MARKINPYPIAYTVVVLITFLLWLDTSIRNNLPYGVNHSIFYLYLKTKPFNALTLLSLLTMDPNTVYLLVSLYTLIAYAAAIYIALKDLKLKNIVSILGLIVFLSLPFTYYSLFQGLLLRVLTAAISSLSLALSLSLSSKRAIASFVLATVASFTYPLYGIILAIILLTWGLFSWNRNRVYAKRVILLANAVFAVLTVAYPLTYVYEVDTSLKTYMIPEFNPVLYLALAFSVIGGLLTIYAVRQEVFAQIVSWIVVPIMFYSYLNIVGSLLLAIPGIVLSIAHIIDYGVDKIAELRRCNVSRDNAWILGIFMIIMLVASSLSIVSFKIFSTKRPVHMYDLQKTIEWFSENATNENTLVLGDLSLLPWIPRRVPNVEPRILEAWCSTTFRIENGYIRADEWEPFSPSRAPLISIYNGSAFEKIIYIDDSYVRLKLTRNGKTWVESPYGMKFIDYECRRGKVILIFQSLWLRVVKTIVLDENYPRINITYYFETLQNITIDKVTAYLWSAWGTSIDKYDKALLNIYMLIAGEHVIFYLPENATVRLIKTRGQQDRVILEVPVRSIKYSLKLVLEFPSAKRSPYPPLTTSLFEFLKRKNNAEKYIVDVADKRKPPKYTSLQAMTSKILYTVDAFNTVEVWVKEYRKLFHISDAYVKAELYVKQNDTLTGPWIETPFNSKVVRETITENELYVTFETPGLFIEKTFAQEEGKYEIRYSFKPKENIVLKNVEVYLWLDLEPSTHVINVNSSVLDLVFSNILFEPKPSMIKITKDPEYGSPIVAIRYENLEGKLEFTMSIQGEIRLNYVKGSRPVVETPDKIEAEGSIYVKYIESPYKSRVLMEVRKGETINITYATPGTVYSKYINKLDNRTLMLRFKVKPAKKLKLYTLNVTFWLPWERVLINSTEHISTVNQTLILTTDIGKIFLEVKPRPLRIVVGPHPKFKQLRVVMVFESKNNTVEAEIKLKTKRTLMLNYLESTRPIVETSDVLEILMSIGYLNEVARVGNYTVIYGVVT